MNGKNVFGTLEWAPFNENFISGCFHNCRYCYSKEMAIRFKRKTAETWPIEQVNKDKLESFNKRYSGRVMFPSSHDITLMNLESSIVYLKKLLISGNTVLLVTKPHLAIIENICSDFLIYKNKLHFRFTIGSLNTHVLNFWEPNAPTFEERFNSLKCTYEKGFSTSISIEPILDTVENTIKLINTLLPFVTDAIWLGKPNHLIRRLKMNGETDNFVFEKARTLENMLDVNTIQYLYKQFQQNKKIRRRPEVGGRIICL